MGRKPSAAKIGKRVRMHENKNQSLERVESQPGNTIPSLKRVENQPKSVNPSLESVELQPETISPSLVRANTQSKRQAESVKPSNPMKKMRHRSGVRRSDRIKSAVMPAQNSDIEPMIEEITLSESEKEDDFPAQREQNLPEPANLGEKNIEEKINHIVQRLEKQEKAMEALKSEVTKKSFLSGSPSRVDIKYKNLYIDSQKKIESLTEENKQLRMKLETALCKVEAYQNANHVFSEMMEKLKDVILISNLTKATETAVNLSSRALHNASSPGDVLGSNGSAAKRKKPTVIRK